MTRHEEVTVAPLPTLRANYRPPNYEVREVDLRFDLNLPVTRVTASYSLDAVSTGGSFVLNGRRAALVDLRVDDVSLPASAYTLTDDGLRIHALPKHCRLTVVTEISPADNPGLEGLNFAGGVFFTHCEPEGFRRITFFPDRPDILARYSCMIVADKNDCPILLSNGNCIETGDLEGGRHYALWKDPFPKASYLFALVAGKFETLADSFTTRSGRRVALTVYASPEDIRHCRFGLDVLKRAMAWDEQAYEREYDLDLLNIAVMRSYPGGAMENKGLNLYTSEVFLASPELSFDDNMLFTQAVVAHEYLHNWTGNRVGCRNWFELSLKEGFTIFRQREFVASQRGETVARIDDVVRLREYQFPEDDGGNAHAVRPQSYMTVSNLYTATVYEKGAELIRALKVLVGEDAFSGGVKDYFDRFDGRAAAIDDLVDAIGAKAQLDLAHFHRWYEVVGPIHVDVRRHYDSTAKRLSLTIRQRCANACPANAFPVRFPIVAGFLSQSGAPIPVRRSAGGAQPVGFETILDVRSEEEVFVFEDMPAGAIPSLFRDYSAPVRISTDLTDQELAVLAARDPDLFNRWDAMQQLAVHALSAGSDIPAEPASSLWLDAAANALAQSAVDPGFAARLLKLPSERAIGGHQGTLDIGSIHRARRALARLTGARLRSRLKTVRECMRNDAGDARAIESRRLANLCQWYLMQAPEPDDVEYTWQQFLIAKTLEGQGSALRLLVGLGGDNRTKALEQSYELWKHSPALLDQWFVIQAASEADDTAAVVAALMRHPDFDLKNGTRVKLTFDAFTTNLAALHEANGTGYRAICSLVLALNKSNPRLAARFLKKLDDWRRLDEKRRDMVTEIFREVLAEPDLSREIFEVAARSLSSN